ncbi:hypothetical protein POM88_042871 [Heracleum sosnowskyi]|uniref:DRBM domain-containing protein n=1 Tax=Heracleum sosnowskyi TaxID=360622 RepID=A0AAD8HHA1_9APIA|nr:hypothetical protein POM88_042871 [Heracleum sosnowskyi]
MNLSALLTSAGINIALCLVLSSLYSILRKQPNNASVHFGQRFAQVQSHDLFCLDRIVPSAGWIVKAWETTEEEDLLTVGGLDAVVFLRIVVFWMFKSKLQELCHANNWALPVYKSVKHGVDHNPYFKATVTIDNTSFKSPQHLPFWSSKEAQNMAAQVALTQFEEIATTRKGRDRPTNYSDTSDDSDESASRRRLKKANVGSAIANVITVHSSIDIFS